MVLPGIGAFINVRQAARFDDTDKKWIPMTREVRFNGALRHDDGLLASSYARKNSLTFEEGREILRKDTDLLRMHLEEDGEVTIGNLGILRKEEECLVFEPSRSAYKVSEMIGFIPIPAKSSHANKSEHKNALPSIDKPDTKAETADNKTGARVFDTERNYYIPVNKMFAKVAAALVLVSVVALGFLMPVSNRRNVDKASVVPVEKIIPAIISEEPESKEETLIIEEKDDNKQPVAFAVVAAFNTHEEAEKYIAYNSKSGYQLQVVDMPKQSRVVALGSDSKEEVYDKMRDGEFKNIFKHAWVWER